MSKIRYLDGLRGLAAFVVVLSHFAVGFYPALYSGNPKEVHTGKALELFISASPLNLIYAGNFAVCIFFILSGFVLSYQYFKFKDIRIIESSAIRRYIRLLIPVLFSFLVAFIFMISSLFYNKQTGIITNSTWWLVTFWDFNPNFVEMMEQGIIGVFIMNQSKYNAVTWTMTYEFYGSFLVFGLAAIFGNSKKRFIFYLIAIALLINTYYYTFILGMFLSDLYASKASTSFNRGYSGNIFSIVLLCIGMFLASYPTGRDVAGTLYSFMKVNNINNLFWHYHTIGAFFMMIAVLNLTKLKVFLENKLLLFLGDISFSLYLIHLIIISSFSSRIFAFLLPRFTYSVSFIIMFCISMVIIILCSYFMNKYIDENGKKLAKYVYISYFKKFK